MRLDILLTTGVVIGSAFALPVSPTSSQRPTDEGDTPSDAPDHREPLSSLVATGLSTYLAYRGLRYLSTVEWNRRLAQWNRQFEERSQRLREQNDEVRQAKRLTKLSNPHGYVRRFGDDVIIQAPNGQLLHVTWAEKMKITDCIRAVANLQTSHQGKFSRCLAYARDPTNTLTIEDVLNLNLPLEEVPKEQPERDDSTKDNNNHFSKAVIDRGHQFIDTAGKNVKDNFLRAVAPLASVRKGESGHVAPLSGGLQRAPGMRLIPPL